MEKSLAKYESWAIWVRAQIEAEKQRGGSPVGGDAGSVQRLMSQLHLARPEPPEQVLWQAITLLGEVVTLRTLVATAQREVTALRRLVSSPSLNDAAGAD